MVMDGGRPAQSVLDIFLMGYALCHGSCIGCGRIFSFNPMRVPSVTINGSREPICEACVERVNPLRKANGLEPIVPFPDAYEPCDESELD
jgi:hypothetical protein